MSSRRTDNETKLKCIVCRCEYFGTPSRYRDGNSINCPNNHNHIDRDGNNISNRGYNERERPRRGIND